MSRKKHIGFIAKMICVFLAIFSILSFLGIGIAHRIVFGRIDYEQYDSRHYLLYSDLDKERYPRSILQIPSGENILTGYLYGAGSYSSQGSSMRGYTQSVHDLDAVLKFVEGSSYDHIPVVLFGHSLGGYASAAVLQFGHTVDAAIIASGFDTPKEQWLYSIERYTGAFHYPLEPFTKLFLTFKYGREQNLSAIDGINSVDIPILVISRNEDEFYGGDSPIYRKRSNITNPNCSFEYKTETTHNGHYDYFLTEEALEYQSSLKNKSFTGQIDKNLYAEHDVTFMKYLNDFLLKAVMTNLF